MFESIKKFFVREQKGYITTTPSLSSTRYHPVPVDYGKLREIYENDPEIHTGINLLSEQVVGPGIYFEGDEADEAMMWAKEIQLDVILFDVVKTMLVYGNAYLQVIREGKKVSELRLLPPSTIRIITDSYGDIVRYIQQVGSTTIEFEADEIIHFKYDSIPGSPYGAGIIKPLVWLYDIRKTVTEDVGVIIEKYVSPRRLWKTPNETMARRLGEILQTIEPDEDIIVSCLLYTSPSPRDLSTSRMPSSA